jgi:hypothetical protein
MDQEKVVFPDTSRGMHRPHKESLKGGCDLDQKLFNRAPFVPLTNAEREQDQGQSNKDEKYPLWSMLKKSTQLR